MCIKNVGRRPSMTSPGLIPGGFAQEDEAKSIPMNSMSRTSHRFASPAFNKESGRDRRISSERRRLHLFIGAATIFALLGLAVTALVSSRSRSDAEKRVEHLAAKVVELKREARRARALEDDERRLEGELSEQRGENRRLRSLEGEERTKLVSMQEEVERIKKEEEEKEEEVGGLLDMVFEQLKVTREEEAKKLREGASSQKAVGLLEGHYKELSKKVQERSREQVLERYGPGPHRVMMKVEIPVDEINFGATERGTHDLGTIIIEMAPLDLMPHSVQLFLDQVHEGLWNGCSFYRNAFHVLQASHKKSGAKNVTERFTGSGLDRLQFQEYSAEFPHVQNTVGFGGMNAGAVLMINKVDNTEVHGPGGQKKKFGVDDGEPCFGRVVSGFDTLDWLSRTPTSNQKGPDYMDNYVKILSASII